MTMVHRALLLFMILITAAQLRASDGPAARVKALYDAAAYDEVLKAIDALDAERSSDAALPPDVTEYRALSLLALDRHPEAEQAIESLLLANPDYRVSAQAPPRWRAAVERVRARTWSVLVRGRYAAAKQAYDERLYAAAADGFDAVMRLLTNGPSRDGSPDLALADLETITKGFLDLSRAQLEPAKSAPVASTDVAEPAPTTPVPEINRLYTNLDTDVIPPIAIRQDVPARRRGATSTPFNGELEIIIDDRGSVERATLVRPLDPSYSALLLNVVRQWRFEPATRNGTPVRYGKIVRIRPAER